MPFILKETFSPVYQRVIKIIRLVFLINFYFVTNPVDIETLKGVIAVEWNNSAAIIVSCVSVSW